MTAWDDAFDADTRWSRDIDREPTISIPRTRTPRKQLDARGSVRITYDPPIFCSQAEHDAGWDTMRRDGVMALAADYILDHRTCMTCKGSFSRKVEPSGEEAIRILRESGLL